MKKILNTIMDLKLIIYNPLKIIKKIINKILIGKIQVIVKINRVNLL